MATIEEYSAYINGIAAENQEQKEVISHEDAATAAAYIRDMAIEDSGDALIYCAALNLLNTYVKQRDAQIGYLFKEKLGYYLAIISLKNLPDIIIDLQRDKNMSLVITQIGKLQFSFHNVKTAKYRNAIESSVNRRHNLEWDGIRKQQCASTVFHLAIGCPVSVSNKTFRGKDLREKVNKTVSNYKNGITSINDILFS